MNIFEYYLLVGVIYSAIYGAYIYSISVKYFNVRISLFDFVANFIFTAVLWPIHLYKIIYVIYNYKYFKALAEETIKDIQKKQ
jgi:hypothetical protein